MPSFNDFIQHLVSEGIAVVAPNVRGSTGYGKTYTHLDDVEKRLDSVRDIDSLVSHLVSAGIAHKDKLAVMGTSYGGFMTLSCAARYPDLWACAIDTVGMYNLVTFLENTAPYRRPHRESEYGSLEKHRELLERVSPAAKIHNITAPIMIIQGRNDPRVPVTEAEQAVAALRALGRTVEYLCYDDEGHGIIKLKNRLDCYPRMAAFLKKYLRV
jgi:dipeptidyl aminopeptidase/acylaminoacyl peptidase